MLRIIIKLFIYTILLLVLLILATTAFLYLAPQFGADPSQTAVARYQQSDNYREGRFVNLVPTQLSTRQPGESLDIATFLFPAEDKNPSSKLPTQKFNSSEFEAGNFVWFGHSTILFRTSELTILTDPVFNRASPIPVGGKPFDMEVAPTIDMLPEIDVVVISHDHYDHLDHIAIGQLASTTELFLVPLGVKAHLEHWGVPGDKIIELDWYESHALPSATFVLTPTRHFSGRGLTNRFTTLWGSWAISTDVANVFYGGDSGYFKEFKRIGEKFGPFDITFLENGAYDAGWAQIHMTPEESVQAAIDLEATLFFPIHWGKFDLAKHQWNEPILRAVVAAKQRKVTLVAPLIGQTFNLTDPPFITWWD